MKTTQTKLTTLLFLAAPAAADRRPVLGRLAQSRRRWLQYLFRRRHGDGPYDCSMTINSDPALLLANKATFAANAAYYIKKWGGPPREEQFHHPFNETA